MAIDQNQIANETFVVVIFYKFGLVVFEQVGSRMLAGICLIITLVIANKSAFDPVY